MAARTHIDGVPIEYVENGWVFSESGLPIDGYVSRCLDCGKKESEYEVHIILPNKDWKIINPSEHGTLCPNCILKRLAATGTKYVYCNFTRGE